MEILGTGFKLREWKTDDAVSLKKQADNKLIFDFLLDRFPHPYTMDDAISWIKLMQAQNPVLVFVIEVNDKLAGAIGLELRVDVYRKTAMIGYWLAQEYWGSGIMTEAAKLVCTYAFSNLAIMRIQAGIFGNNTASMRVLEKAGFTKEAVLKYTIFKNGIFLDEHIYAILKT